MTGVIFNLIGTVGVVFILVAYFMLQMGRMSFDQVRFPLVNFIGSALILVSLTHSWNLPSVIIEVCWMSISLYGVVKNLKKKSTGVIKNGG